MKRQLIIRPEAEADITDAFDWYEELVPDLGAEFLLAIDAIFESILRNPAQYPMIYKSIHRAIPRRFPYLVYFLVEDERVIILAVSHAKRSSRHWKGRRS